MKANLTDEDRFVRQDQRAYSASSPLVILAIIVLVIGIGFFMMLFTNYGNGRSLSGIGARMFRSNKIVLLGFEASSKLSIG